MRICVLVQGCLKAQWPWFKVCRVASSFPGLPGRSWLCLYQAAWEGFPALCQDTTCSSSLPPVPGFRARAQADGLEGSRDRLQQVLCLDGQEVGLEGQQKASVLGEI